MIKQNKLTKEENKLLNTTFLYSSLHFVGSDNVVSSGTGVLLTMLPALKYFYKDDRKKFKDAMQRYFEYYNCHSVASGLIIGIVLAMEKKKAEGADVSGESISNIKTSLMGPLAGIGDSFFYNCVRTIIAAVAIGMGANGNVLAPIFFFLTYFGIQFACKYFLMREGYIGGSTLIDSWTKSGILGIFTKCAGVVGLIMVGYMIASTVKVSLAFAPVINGVAVNFQTDIFDAIAPGVLSLGVWYIVYHLIKKGKKPTMILYGIMLICIILSFFGIL